MLDLNGIAQNEHVLWQVHLDRQIIPISAQHHLEQGSVNRLAQIETRFDKALVERAQPQPFDDVAGRSEEHTSELQSLMRISYAVFCLKKKKPTYIRTQK